MDEADRTRRIAEYIADRVARAVTVYREIYRDDQRPAAARNIEYLVRRSCEICVESESRPEEFVETYKSVLRMTPAEIITDVLRKG